MKYFTLLLTILLPIPFACAQWQLQNSGTTENLNDITIAPYTNGNSLFVVGDNGTILKTTNNGNEWISISIGMPNNLTAVSFCTSNDGVVVGDNIILITTDGGESWADTVINKNAIRVNYYLSEFWYLNILIGCDDGTLFYYSTPYNWWQDTILTNEPVIAIGMTDLGLHVSPAVFTTNSFTADTYLPIDSTSIWKYYNNPLNPGDSITCGELNWDYQYLVGIAGSSESEILLLKKYFWSDTLWVPKYSLVSSNFIPEDIAIYYDYNLFICGSDGKIFTSVDDGVNWLEQYTGVNNKLNSIVFGYNDSIGYSVGDEGIILFTSNGGGINKVEEEPSPIGYYLSQNYPNPFNPSTKIDFRIEEFGFVTLKVYDVLGNEISTLVNEEMSAGDYEVVFNVDTNRDASLPSGVYFYQLKAGNYIETKKMILAK